MRKRIASPAATPLMSILITTGRRISVSDSTRRSSPRNTRAKRPDDAKPQYDQAVVAFQKWSGLGRDGVVGPATRTALTSATRPTPIRAATGRRIEVLLDRQVTLVIDGGRVTRILDVTTGKPGFETPVSSWRVFRKEARSWSVPYRVWLPWASYFVGGVAFHEYPTVPPVPASHGCVRVPRWDAHWLYTQTPMGTPVTVIGRSR